MWVIGGYVNFVDLDGLLWYGLGMLMFVLGVD